MEAGIDYFMLHTMTPDIAQLDLWVRDIVPNVKFPVMRGRRRRDEALTWFPAFQYEFERKTISAS